MDSISLISKLVLAALVALGYFILFEVWTHVIARNHRHLSTARQTLHSNHPQG